MGTETSNATIAAARASSRGPTGKVRSDLVIGETLTVQASAVTDARCKGS
jgi:hypothetical protein